jgi:hypothetical protein
MPGRRRCRRRVARLPEATFYRPDIPHGGVVVLYVEEYEAFRLVDFLGLTQHEAAAEMGISQKALWNDLKSARYKISRAIIYGMAIRIEGGSYAIG